MLKLLCLLIAVASLSTIEMVYGQSDPSYPGLMINCDDCPRILDLCFVLDGSQSICKDDPNYQKGDTTCVNWKSFISFTHNFVDAMNIGEGLTHAGLVIFATKGNRRFNLTRNTDKPSLLAAIDQVPYPAGNTNISGGMDVMMNLVFNETFGDRPNVQNVALFFTDARSTDPSTVQPAIDRVHAANVKTYAIGLDASVQQLASDPKQINKTYFVVNDFKNLEQIRTQVQSQICNDSS